MKPIAVAACLLFATSLMQAQMPAPAAPATPADPKAPAAKDATPAPVKKDDKKKDDKKKD